MKIDAVFSGGGVKAFAFIGALQSIKDKKLQIERVAGTSAGAMLAGFLAAGYSLSEIEKVMGEIQLQKLLDPPKITTFIPLSRWFFLYFQMGLNRGNLLENWIHEKLAAKGVYAFSDLPHQKLKVVVSDLTLGKLIVLPDDLQRVYGIDPKYFSVAKAIRMSAGFPYFFMPKKLPGKTKEKSLIVDGGLLSNFPLWIFDRDQSAQTRPVLGIKLSESLENIQPRKIKNAIDMFLALFSTMKQAHDARFISKSEEKNIIFIPVNNILATDFQIQPEIISELVEAGRTRADQFLKKWPR
ncbi:patatin-like phospholipase family protein [Virgibacillus halophilus]|uniref:patatin-like phospholipase family protein n=1 Tax=Tigheibacillus halophilus TaxID=361280 RepID=UPI003626602E